MTSNDTSMLTFLIDNQPVEPVIIQLTDDDLTFWTFRPAAQFSLNAFQPKHIPGRGLGADFLSVGLDVKCSCKQLDCSTIFDVIGFNDDDDFFGGYILRGVSMSMRPHQHLEDLSNILKERYDVLLAARQSGFPKS